MKLRTNLNRFKLVFWSLKGWGAGGVQFDIRSPVFPKMYFLETEWGPVFFAFLFNFNIIISHTFPENVIIKIPQVVQKIWRFSPSILALFIYFSDFLTFPYYKETNGVTYNRWCQQFFTFNLLLIGCLTLLTFMFVPDIVTWVKISLKWACDQEEI